jgi:hypothetical protein
MSAMARRVACTLIALALAAAIVPGGALTPRRAPADGDPASDILLAQNVFYPFSPPVSNALQRTLNAETAAAQKAGLALKVALIGSPADLGAIPELYGKPQAYANFLDREISFNGPAPLLVVMAAGYGVRAVPTAAIRAVAALPKPTAGKANNGLAQAAITAVAKIADASGHPIKSVVASGTTTGGGNPAPIIVGVLAVAAVLGAGAVIVLRRRQTAARPAR